MKTVKGLNGRSYKWNMSKFRVFKDESRPRSKYHILARQEIKSIYGSYSILEEVKIPGTKLYLDFFVPNLNLVIEVHGEQHYSYIPFFHKSKIGYLKSLKRDNEKIRFCELNNIGVVILKYDEQHNWRELLISV